MRRVRLSTVVMLAAHLTFWIGSSRDADAAVLRWRTNGTNCHFDHFHSAATYLEYQGSASHAGKTFWDTATGDYIDVGASCFVPTGRDLVELFTTNGRRLHSVNLRLEQIGSSNEYTTAYLVTNNFIGPTVCTCDTKMRYGAPGTFPLYLSYAACANSSNCGTDWGVGVDLDMTDTGGGGPKALKVRLLSAYSD